MIELYGCKIKLKSESSLMKLIGFISKPFNPNFMSTTWTTVFTTVFAPSSFDLNNPEKHERILKHEKIHIEDFQRYHVFYVLTYLFPPVILSYGRFHWEFKAYLPELVELAETHQYSSFYKRLNEIVNMLGGPMYFWCLPKSYIRKQFLRKTNMPEE